MHCVSQALEELVDVIRVAGLINGKILSSVYQHHSSQIQDVTKGILAEKTYRVAILSVLTRGNIVSARQPGNLLATITDSKDWNPQVEECRIDIFHSVSLRVPTTLAQTKTYEERPHPSRMRVLDTKISRSSSEKDQMALASAEDDSLGRPVQLLGLGRTGQNLTEHIERSEAPEDQVRCLASKVQEQNRLHIPKLILIFFVRLFARG